MRRAFSVRYLAVAFVIGLAAAGVPLDLTAQVDWPTFSLPFGKNAIGVKSVLVDDSTRHLASGAPRPVQVVLWYPASAASSAARMTYADYFALSSSELTVAPSADSVKRAMDDYRAFLTKNGAPAADVSRWMAAPLQATRDARPAGGPRPPILVLAQGNAQSAHEQAIVAEFLTSHGYIVATTPSPMRITGEMTSTDEVGARAQEQAVDLAIAVAIAARSGGDTARIGIVGHSFGARAALLYVMTHPRVRALVSLDGGIGTATGRTSFEAARTFSAAAARLPILHVYEELDAYMKPDFGLLESLSGSDRWLVRATDMHHHHFTSLGAVSAMWPSIGAVTLAASGTGASYTAVANATLDFLDAFVKADSAAARRVAATTWPRGMEARHLAPNSTPSR